MFRRVKAFVRLCVCLQFLGAFGLHAGPLDDAVRRVSTAALKPGYGICVFDAKGVRWSSCEGLADEDKGVPFSEDTVVRLGGTSELFTIALALQQAEAGRLDLDQPVRECVPELFEGANPGSALERIGQMKVRLLLSHLTGTDATFFLGFPDYDPFVNLGTYLRGATLKFPPGFKYVRSGAMVDLLGLILQKTSGTGFEELGRTALFEPLNMKSTSFRFLDSPLFASLRYKSAAPNSYATQISGFREIVVPSGSMQSSLRDLTAFYASVFRGESDASPRVLSSHACEAMLTTQSEPAAQRQGQHFGFVWRLTLPELDYLGRVAWYSGKFFSHRNVVILLPDLGFGVVCVTNAWNIIDRDTILPLSIEVAKAYAKETLGIREPEPPLLRAKVLPASLRAHLSGVYASASGVFRVDAQRESLHISSEIVEADLVHVGGGIFRAQPDSPAAEIHFVPPKILNIRLRNGLLLEADNVRPRPAHQAWLKLSGTYRIVNPAPGALYAFTLSSFHGLPCISGDDGVPFLVEALPNGEATIRCDETSRFFGSNLQRTTSSGLLLGGLVYQRSN